jgi:ribose transport system ATP-binding protein
MSSDTPRLEIRALNKTFGEVKVLTDVELTVLPGEIHGLVGQNGSGKSTLIKILTGYHAPDSGAEYRVDGQPMRLPASVREIRRAGVAVVHQDLGLLDQLSVAENVCVGGFPTTRIRRISRSESARIASGTLARLGIALNPRRPVGTLSAAERAEVAIARAMRDHADDGGLVILDESTRALVGTDLKRIHELLRAMVARGSSVLLISHNLTEVGQITDRVTILRDGRVVAAGRRTAELSGQDIARYMLGSTVAGSHEREQPVQADAAAAMSVTGLASSRLEPLDLSIQPREVLGITGLPGSGYEQIPYLLAGAQQATAGRMTLNGAVLNLAKVTVAGMIRAGVVLVPERRDRDGLAFEQSVRDNITLPALRNRGTFWHVSRGWQRADAARSTKELGIRPDNPQLLVKQLSGGNQQKVLLSKWLNVGPQVLILHEPTQAVDVGARQDILNALRRAADSGKSVLIVSSEAEDLAAACDRVLVYVPGRGLVQASELTPDHILELTYQNEGSPA